MTLFKKHPRVFSRVVLRAIIAAVVTGACAGVMVLAGVASVVALPVGIFVAGGVLTLVAPSARASTQNKGLDTKRESTQSKTPVNDKVPEKMVLNQSDISIANLFEPSAPNERKQNKVSEMDF